MSDVRMSDVFDLPTIVDVELACIRDGKAIDIANFDIKDTGIARTKAAAHAINTHDTMQARIVELEAALTNIKKHQETAIVGMPQLSATWQIASRALEK